MAKKNVIEQMIGMLRTPIAQRKGVAIPPNECAIWAKELERYLVIEKEKKDQLETKEVDLDDKDKWKNTGGFGSTWDPDSPDYYPD